MSALTPEQIAAWLAYQRAMLTYQLNKERAQQGAISTHQPVHTV